MNATTCSTPGTLKLSYSAKSRIVSKCTTDLSSPFLSRSSVCLACRQETGFRVSVHSRRSWGNVEKGWGFWGFHKRGSRNLFETILHKQTPIQRANRVWNRPALSSNDQIYVPGCLFAAPEQRKGGFSVIKTLRIACRRNRLKSPETNHKQKHQSETYEQSVLQNTAEKLIQKPQNTLLFNFKYTLLGVWWYNGKKYCFIILVWLFWTQVFHNVKLFLHLCQTHHKFIMNNLIFWVKVPKKRK